jgi:hypothetical protein
MKATEGKIISRGFLDGKMLFLLPEGIKFRQTSAFSSVRKFDYRQVDAIVMAPDDTLSFQVGREVFSIPTNPGDKKHEHAIQLLLDRVRGGNPQAGLAAPNGPPEPY